MDDIRNDVFWRFRDVTKQNGHASYGDFVQGTIGGGGGLLW